MNSVFKQPKIRKNIDIDQAYCWRTKKSIAYIGDRLYFSCTSYFPTTARALLATI
jgi:hypothetical protein